MSTDKTIALYLDVVAKTLVTAAHDGTLCGEMRCGCANDRTAAVSTVL